MLSAVRRSLRAKVLIIVLMTTFAALLVSTIVLLTYEVENYRDTLVADATTQADILARINASALAFDDQKTAESNLALLNNRPNIRAAAIYAVDGGLFATYSRTADAEFPPLGAPGARFDASAITLFHPVVHDGVVLGTLYLQASYELAGRLRDYLVILAPVMAMSLLVALLISFWLAGTVTGPVRAVTQVAREVIERRDFTLRARRTTEDEIGVLVNAFNTMLAEVGQRAAALEDSNRALQKETEERRHAEAGLRLADQHKDEFLATLAHELRNPLAPMVNAMGLVAMPGADRAITNRAHGIITRQLSQMVRLVDDLLDVSRITSGKLAVRKQSVDLASIVHNAVDTARPLLDERRHTLTLELPSRPIYLQADPVRLAQVFSNLLNNAAKYSEPGGNVTLSAALSGSNVRVCIDDHGIGISADTLPRIFEMFAQGDSSLERTQSGLGVGLALAKRLIELHGGSITAESLGLGQGSSFTVVLPVRDALAAESSSAGIATPEARAHRVLLVDDNVDFATSLALLLRNLGHEVWIAHDAEQALVVARERAPEFAFLDLGLPEVSGYELAHALRAQPETASTVLIALSGWGQARDRQRSQEAGFSLHLVKPVELQNIQAVLANLARAG